MEGFFVTRMAGEAEARRHHLTEDLVAPPTSARQPAEGPPPLPRSYGARRAVLMVRDPETLFFFWDAPAVRGPGEARATLRLYEDGGLVREMDAPLDSGGFYLHGLAPGHTYHVEALAPTAAGELHRIAPPSEPVTLPPGGPSRDLSVQMVRIPWQVPLAELPSLLTPVESHSERMGLPERLELPASHTVRLRAGLPQGPSHLPPWEGLHPPSSPTGARAGGRSTSQTRPPRSRRR